MAIISNNSTIILPTTFILPHRLKLFPYREIFGRYPSRKYQFLLFIIDNVSMKSKTFLLAALLGAVITSESWAIGLGAQFNGNISTDPDNPFVPGWALAISPKDKIHFSVFWDFARDSSSIFGMTADFWLLNPDITQLGSAGSLGFFVGPGFYASFGTAGSGNFSFGVRIPVGVNLHLLKNIFEVYLQVAPSWGIHLYPSLGLDDHMTIPLSLGARFWIGG
jgi:hypothetical protein